VAALIVLVASPLAAMFGALVTTERHIVGEDETVSEDQYVTAVSSSVEGTIDGDLTLFAGTVTISGTVEGDLTVFSSGTVTITPTGRVGGSLNGAASALSLQGDVDGDVFIAAGSVVVEPGAGVGRDVIAFGGSTRIEGIVGRDVRGRALRMSVDGRVRGDVDVATTILTIGSSARIGGDVLYRSSSDADIAEGAFIAGTVTKLPAQSNFIYGIILSLANVVGFLAFVVAGLIALWLLRGVGSRATGAVLTKPIRSLLTGILAVLVVPVAIALFAITLVGIPISIVLVAFVIVAFIIGAVPAVTALGNLALLRRGGLFGAFLVGAVLWRLGIWLIPYVGGALFVLALVWGIGGWILGAFAARRADPTPAMLLPASIVAAADANPEWVPPRAPGVPAPAEYDRSEDDTEPSRDLGDAGSVETRPPADPGIQRDLTFTAAAVTFDDGTGADAPVGEVESGGGDTQHPEVDPEVGPADADSSTLDEKLAAFRSELEATVDAPGSDPAPTSPSWADEPPVPEQPRDRAEERSVEEPAGTDQPVGVADGPDADPGGDETRGEGVDRNDASTDGEADDGSEDPGGDEGVSDWGLPRR
jgi:cytoskeletal protein CcmA (bactofilin family)